MTYILWKKNRKTDPFTSKVEAVRQFWLTPGPYLRRSMLVALGRNISGNDLPESLVQGRTFEDDEVSFRAEDRVGGQFASSSRAASIIAAVDIEKAMLTSMKNASSDVETGSSSTINEDEEDSIVLEDCSDLSH